MALAILIGSFAAAGAAAAMPGVKNPTLAQQHWVLQCQGCHRPTATGTPRTTPRLNDFVARFLSVPGGREYLGRVPGVATAALSDAELTDLLNWTLRYYDAANIPAGFRPYTTEEVGRLRRQPYRTEASSVRQRLIEAMNGNKVK